MPKSFLQNLPLRSVWCSPWYGGALIWIGLDQWSKWLADSLLPYGRSQELLPIFDLTLLYNRGAAFSFLSDAGGWQRWVFSLLSAVVSVFLIVEIPRQKSRYSKLAFAMILSGALGNLIDRVRLGYVVDFVHLHWQEHYFPAFNLADAAISIGVCFLLIDWYFIERREKNA